MRASVLVNSHQYVRYVGEAIASALDQTWPDVEVVVVDDGSTDGSVDVIRSFGDRVVPVLQANGGQASAINAGFARSTGDVVLLLDADDRFLPTKVEAVVAALAADGALGWCFHPLAHEGGPGVVPSGRAGRVDAREALRRGRPHGALAPATSGLAFRRPLLEQLLPMPEHLRVPLPGGARGTAADAFLKPAALGLAPGVVLEERLAVQRIHGANAYTGTRWADPKRAALELLVADELRRRWPTLRRHALHKGLGGLRRLAWVDDPTPAEPAVHAFLAGCTPAERARVRAHQAVWRLRPGDRAGAA